MIEASTLFYIILAILIVDFFVDNLLSFLNTTKWRDIIPEELRGIYDNKKYQESIQYDKTNYSFDLFSDSFNFMLIFSVITLGGLGVLDLWVREITDNAIGQALFFFGILFIVSNIVGIPFSYYSTFTIEKRFGFNKTTIKTFWLDKVKGLMLTFLIGFPLLALIIWFYTSFQVMFWLYAWGTISVFSMFMNLFYVNLILPLFNKQTPLEGGELRNEIVKLSDKVGFKLNNIFVMDGSKRSTKANAFFSGLGSKKRIVLFDTLIKDLSKEEIVAVLAHEIGHYKKKHSLYSLIFSLLHSAIMLYILDFFVADIRLSEALGSTESSFHIGVVAFGILYSPISTLLGMGMNILSRKHEYEADNYAKKNYSAEYLGNALKKLSVTNLSNLNPHPLYVFFNYSHPTVLQRLKAMGV